MRDTDLPALFQAADEAANTSQYRYFLATRATLITAVLAALFGAISLETGGTDWAAVVAIIALVVGLLVGIYLLSEHPERKWYDARAAAESTKTLAWRYAAGGSDFPIDSDEATVERNFLARLGQLSQGLTHITLPAAPGGQLTPAMRQLRSAGFEERKQAYRNHRLNDQRGWYSAAATINSRRAFQWRLTSLGAQLVGIIGGLLRATETIHFDLLGIAASAAAAALAWLQTREHSTLAEAYSVAARELALADEQARVAQPEEWPIVVDNTEAAISREHTLWKARRSSITA